MSKKYLRMLISIGKLMKNLNQLLSEMLRYRVYNFNHVWVDISFLSPPYLPIPPSLTLTPLSL